MLRLGCSRNLFREHPDFGALNQSEKGREIRLDLLMNTGHPYKSLPPVGVQMHHKKRAL